MQRYTRSETRICFLKTHLEEMEANLAANLRLNETLLNTVQLLQRTVVRYQMVNPTLMVEGTISPESIKHLTEQYSELFEDGRKGIMKSEELSKRPNYREYFKMRKMRLVIKELQEIHATLELSSFANALEAAIPAAPADAVSAASSGKMSDVPADTVSTARTEAMSATSADPLCIAGADAVSATSSCKMFDVSADTVSTDLTEAMSATRADPLFAAIADALSVALAEAADDILE